LVDSGSFEMGSDNSESCRQTWEGPVHTVTLSWPLAVLDHEVTNLEWGIAGGGYPSWFKNAECQTNDCPAERINWYDALAYCNAVSRKEGLPECYDLSQCSGFFGAGCSNTEECTGGYSCAGVSFKSQACPGYRLPTEAEWEYFARAGSLDAFPFPPPDGSAKSTDCTCTAETGLEQWAWYCKNSNGHTHPTGTHSPNAWGLREVLGNVAEWCFDGFAEGSYGTLPKVDPVVPQGSLRVARGGGYSSLPSDCRTASRLGVDAAQRSAGVGLRLVRSLTGCVPDCKAKFCGSDGCGGQCGQCLSGEQCVDGRCGLPCADGNSTPWDGCTDGITSEFLVGTEGLGAVVTTLADGGFVVAWTGTAPPGEIEIGVRAVVFAPDGSLVSPEFGVNTWLKGTQGSPAVAARPGGGFVVAWESVDQDGSSWGVFAQRFTAAGAKDGPEFPVNSGTTQGSQTNPTVVVLPDDSFVIAFVGPGSGKGTIWARSFNASGVGLDDEVLVSWDGAFSDAAALSDGSTLIVWDQGAVFQRRLAPDGQFGGSPEQVSAIAGQCVYGPRVSAVGDAGHVVVWEEAHLACPGGIEDILARRYDPDGSSAGPAGVANSFVPGQQLRPDVAGFPDGRWVAVWGTTHMEGIPNSKGIAARVFASDGQPQGTDFLVNSDFEADQKDPAVATFADGSWIVVWDAMVDQKYSVYAQRFNPDGTRRYK
jgi:formylglycine-generating enzyme required for sulfatase activity